MGEGIFKDEAALRSTATHTARSLPEDENLALRRGLESFQQPLLCILHRLGLGLREGGALRADVRPK